MTNTNFVRNERFDHLIDSLKLRLHISRSGLNIASDAPANERDPELVAELRANGDAMKEYFFALDEENDRIKRAAAAAAEIEELRVIPGLAELKLAQKAEADYDFAFQVAVARDMAPPKRPSGPSSDDLKRDYPVAAAYIEAEKYADKMNVDMRMAGHAAMRKILAGGDPVAALKEMRNCGPDSWSI